LILSGCTLQSHSSSNSAPRRNLVCHAGDRCQDILPLHAIYPLIHTIPFLRRRRYLSHPRFLTILDTVAFSPSQHVFLVDSRDNAIGASTCPTHNPIPPDTTLPYSLSIQPPLIHPSFTQSNSANPSSPASVPQANSQPSNSSPQFP
jgi:hypothetical protein